MAIYIGSVCEPGAGLTGGPAWSPVSGTLIWARRREARTYRMWHGAGHPWRMPGTALPTLTSP